MPYIKQKQRSDWDRDLEPVLDRIRICGAKNGDLAYIIYKIANELVKNNFNYLAISSIFGIIETVKFELYRKVVAPFEDEKEEENGEIL